MIKTNKAQKKSEVSEYFGDLKGHMWDVFF